MGTDFKRVYGALTKFLISTCCGQFSAHGTFIDDDGHYSGECGMCGKEIAFLEDGNPLDDKALRALENEVE